MPPCCYLLKMSDEKLSDNQAHDLLTEARRVLGEHEAETVRADTALKAARRTLSGLALALLYASERGEDRIEGIRDQDDS